MTATTISADAAAAGSQRERCRPSWKNAAPAANAVSTTTPLHPAARNVAAITTSASHSCATHGAPALLNENGSAPSTARWSIIQPPAAMWENVSPSFSTPAENSTSASMATPPNQAAALAGALSDFVGADTSRPTS